MEPKGGGTGNPEKQQGLIEPVEETGNMPIVSDRPSPLIPDYCRGAVQLDPQVVSPSNLFAEGAF